MRKILLILGAARYPYRPDLALPAFARAHQAFRSAMVGGSARIVADEDCLDLFDSDLAWVEQRRLIREWLAGKAEEAPKPDNLLVYYVGHGGIGRGGEEVFVTINSTDDDPYFSSIPRDSLAKLLRGSASDFRKFLIIDCCFAAAVVQNMQSPIQDKMTVELGEVAKAVSKPDSGGLAALCASSSIASADAGGRDGLTQFTDGLLSALELGDPSSSTDISFETLRALIEMQLHARYGPEAVAPSSYFADDRFQPVHRIPLFPNRAERSPEIFAPRAHRPDPQPRDAADGPLQMASGNPSGASGDADNFLIVRPQYAAAFNARLGRPNWVSWQFRYSDLGKAPRSDRWLADPLLPPQARDLSPAHFAGSHFDRGHLCPPHNRSASAEDNAAVFRLSNLVAQSPVRNQRLWNAFEVFCRELVQQKQCDLFIISGPLGSLRTIADGRIDVPAALWKIVLCVREGDVPGPALGSAEVLAIRMSNHERAAISHWTEALVTVSAIEDETGYVFLETMARELAGPLKRRLLSDATAAVIGELTEQAMVAPARGPSAPDAEAAPGPGERDQDLFEAIRSIEQRIAKVFQEHEQRALSTTQLQALARPIEREAVRLTHLGIVEELLDREGSGSDRDAAVFIAAVIIYKRQERQFLGKLLEVASHGHPVRGAAMWRVLRAIRRIAPQGGLTDPERRALVAALANCAREYDSPAGSRFQGRDILLLIAQTAALRSLRIDLARDGIFSAQQVTDWDQARKAKTLSSSALQPPPSPEGEDRSAVAINGLGSTAERLKREIEERLAVPEAIASRYDALVKSGNAGVIRLVADRQEIERVYRGGGSYYSFVRRVHEYGHGSDIQLENGRFRVGFAGLDFGYFLQLGAIPITEVVDGAAPAPPAWLPERRRAAWEFLWRYAPPRTTAEARRDQGLRSRTLGGEAGSTISETAPVLAGHSYLLRSIAYRDSDILVALHVDSILANGDVILVWKLLESYDTPQAVGPEPGGD